MRGTRYVDARLMASEQFDEALNRVKEASRRGNEQTHQTTARIQQLQPLSEA